MSWNWNEEMEQKTYESKGAVTISTEEYRDMITKMYALHAAGQKEHDDWRKEYKRADDLQKKLDEAEKRLVSFDVWLEDDDASKAKYKLWKVEQLEKKGAKE